MSNKSYKSDRKTITIDATGQIIGRFASRIANLLIGKSKRTYAPNIDDGDFVIVQNVGQMSATGKKLEQKEYKHYSGYPGGLKRTQWGKMFSQDPKKLLRLAVARMLPKNKLRTPRINRLKIE